MQIITVQPITDRPIIDAIAPDDFMLIGDASDNNAVKRVLVSSLKTFFTGSSSTPTLTPAPTPTPFALRIDCGAGFAYTDTSNKTWIADTYRVRGDVYVAPSAPINDPNSTLYLSEAYDFKYEIPLSNGSYTVNLHFAEIDAGANNSRFFNVALNGQLVLSNYGISNDAGMNTPAIKSFPISIVNGALVIDSQSLSFKLSKICAIEILGS